MPVQTGGEGGVPVPHQELLHHDVVTAGLLQGAALSAGGQLAAVRQA